jgi:hypothetical protein
MLPMGVPLPPQAGRSRRCAHQDATQGEEKGGSTEENYQNASEVEELE